MLDEHAIAINKIKAGDNYQAIEILEKLIKKGFKSAELLADLGLAYHNVNDLIKAVDNYKESLLIDSANHYVWFNLGLAYEMLKEYHNAINAYEKAKESAAESGNIKKANNYQKWIDKLKVSP